MTELHVLGLPDFSNPFEVTTDASRMAIGAVLSQHDHPISYFSKKLSPRMQSASACIRELLAITEAVKKWRHYLLGTKFYIFTDHQSLKHILTQQIQTPEQQKWVLLSSLGMIMRLSINRGAKIKLLMHFPRWI